MYLTMNFSLESYALTSLITSLFLGTEPVSLEGKDPIVIASFLIVCSLLLYRRVIEPEFDPLNMLKNSPKLARTSGLAKNSIKCKN